MEESSIEMYFDEDEWRKLTDLEKRRYVNIKRNFEVMKSNGLCPKVPDFMQNKKKSSNSSKSKPKKQECDGMSEITQMFKEMSDMNPGWPAAPPTPAQKRLMKDIEKKLDHVDWSPYEVSLSPKESKHISQLLKSAEKHLKFLQDSLAGNSEGSESSSVRRYPKRQVPAVCYTEEKIPSEDEWLFCEDCEREYEGDCPLHGPMLRVRDKKVPSGYVADRAFRTCPKFLSVCRSGIRGAGLGIWTEIPLPKGIMFGPYVGKMVKNKHQAEISGYAWEIRRGGKVSHYLEGSDPSSSNWLRFVNCAQIEQQQNLIAFQYAGKIYYRTYKPVTQYTELLVWYGDEYAEDLGIDLVEDLEGGEDYCKTTSTSSGQGYEVARRSVQIRAPSNTSAVAGRRPWAQVSIRKKTIVEHRGKMPLCLYCGENFEDRWTLKGHRCGRDELEVPERGLSENSGVHAAAGGKARISSSADTKGSPGNSSYQCPHCDYRATRSGDLKKHVTAVHLGEKPHKCPDCEYRATRSGDLKKHVTAVHLGEKPHKCPHCEYRATRSENLKSHVTAVHLGEKPHKCPHCDYRATTSGHLKRHVTAVHLGQKPHKCPHCDYRATRSDSLKTHVTAVHSKKKPVNERTSDVESPIRDPQVE